MPQTKNERPDNSSERQELGAQWLFILQSRRTQRASAATPRHALLRSSQATVFTVQDRPARPDELPRFVHACLRGMCVVSRSVFPLSGRYQSYNQ